MVTPIEKNSFAPFLEALFQYLNHGALYQEDERRKNASITISLYVSANRKLLSTVLNVFKSIPGGRIKLGGEPIDRSEIEFLKDSIGATTAHEFSHFFSFQLWKRRGFQDVHPSLSGPH